jgi:hypothetical protein
MYVSITGGYQVGVLSMGKKIEMLSMGTRLNVDYAPGGDVVMSLKRVLWYCPFKNLNMESFGACYLKNDIVASGGVECCFFSLPPPPHTSPNYIK